MADNKYEIDVGDEPRGLPLRGKATGIIKLNKKLLMLAGAVLIGAAVVAVFTFNQTGSSATGAMKSAIGSQEKVKPVTFRRENQWYAKKADTVSGLDSKSSGAPPSWDGGPARVLAPGATEGASPADDAADRVAVPAGVPNLTGQAVSPIEAATAGKSSVPQLANANGRPVGSAPISAARQAADQAMVAAARAPLAAAGFGDDLGRGISQAVEKTTGASGLAYPGAAQAALSAKAPSMPFLPAPGQGGDSGDQNQQNQKNAFMAGQRAGSDGLERVRPASPNMVLTGTVIPAVMISGINSDLPGQVIAQVRENVYDTATGRFTLIPQGARLVGQYDSHVAYGQSRILIAWQRVIYPDGSSVNLKGMPGADFAGLAGFEDIVHSHYGRIFGAAILMSGITAGISLSQPNQTSANGTQSSSSTLSSAVGQQLGQTGMALTQKNMNIQPTLEIRPGYKFNVMVTADLSLPPMGT